MPSYLPQGWSATGFGLLTPAKGLRPVLGKPGQALPPCSRFALAASSPRGDLHCLRWPLASGPNRANQLK
jgi:hypothetical protein